MVTRTSRRVAGRIIGAVAGIAVAALVMTGCGASASNTGNENGTAATAEIDENAIIEAGISYPLSGTFDPINASSAVALAANNHIFEGLVDLDPATREPYPALAAELPTQVDDTTYEVTIRDGATFQDGSPVTASDVVFSYERVLDPANASFFLSFVDFIDSVTAKDDTTVTITTKYPFDLIDKRLGVVKIVPQALVEADPEGYGALPIGSGPYKLVSATPDDAVVFERYDDYNGPRPALAAGMNWNLLADAAARTTALSSGTIQAMEDVPYIDIDTLGASAEVESVQSFGLLFMMFKTNQAPFDDPRVRQAFLYALDMDKIIDTGMLGNATAATGFLPEDHPNYHEASTVYTYDPEKAKELLTEAGVSDMSITLLTTDTAWVKDVAPLVKESLDAIGINTTLDIGQSGSQYGKIDAGDYEVMLAPGDPSVFGNDPDVLLRWWYGAGTWPDHRMYWSETPEFAELTELLDAARQQSGAEQQETWNQAFDLISEQVPLYPLLHRKVATAWDPNALVGFEPLSTTGLSFLDVGVAAQ